MSQQQPRALTEQPLGAPASVVTVGGSRSFRRRVMEMGLTPGAAVTVIRVAPLGDPLELEVRRSRLSIRRAEAAAIQVTPR